MLALLTSRPLSAQVERASHLWDVGVYPTMQVISTKLAGEHVWSGGLNLSVARRLTTRFRAEAGVTGAFAPQLNYKDQATLNSFAVAANVAANVKPSSRLNPYLAVGVGQQRFVYDDAPASVTGSTSYSFARAALGVQVPVGNRVSWRTEVARQFSSHGAMQTFMSGASVSFAPKGVRK